jgi:hypothetical protein
MVELLKRGEETEIAVFALGENSKLACASRGTFVGRIILLSRLGWGSVSYREAAA